MNIPSLMLSALLPRLAARMNVLLWIPEPSGYNVSLPRLLFDSSAWGYASTFLPIVNIPIHKETVLTEDREAGIFIRTRGHIASGNRFKPNRQIVLGIECDDLKTRFYEHKPT